MASLRVWSSFVLIAGVILLAAPLICQAQAPAPPAGGAALDPAPVGTDAAASSRSTATSVFPPAASRSGNSPPVALRREAGGRRARCFGCATSVLTFPGRSKGVQPFM